MNVLHISPDGTFTEKILLPFCKEEKKIGIRTYIASPSISSETRKNKENKNLVFLDIQTKVSKHPLELIKTISSINSNIKEYKIDLIIFHTSIDSFILMIFLKFLTKIDFLYINHGAAFLGYKGINRIILSFIEIININISKSAYTINESMKNEMSKLFFCKNKINTLSPGTFSGIKINYKNIETLLRDKVFKNATTFTYIGRPVKRKGLHDFLKAASESQGNYQFFIIGCSKEKFEKLKVNDNRIVNIGFTYDIEKYLLESDFLCVPSHHEGFGQVYLEAASYGVIPIACNIPGPTEFIINGYNGFLVSPHSPKEITKIINSSTEILKRRKDLISNCLNSYQTYEADLVIKSNLEKIYSPYIK